MKVTLLASTTQHPEGFSDDMLSFNMDAITERWMDRDPEAEDAENLIEFAGRSCYQSFHKPNPATRKNSDYIANIIAQGHFSVLEHASATFYIEGVSRSLSHEIIRHRHLSFSELSQRFVNVEDAEMVSPPALNEGVYEFADAEIFDRIREEYGEVVRYLMDEKGLPRKQAREAARAVMPNATETRIVVTGNHRAFRDMLYKRYSAHADAEIRELATELLRQLREIAPAVYADFPEVPFE